MNRTTPPVRRTQAGTGQPDFLAGRPRCADLPPDENIGNSTDRKNSKVLGFYKSDRLIANPQTIKAARLDRITWANLEDIGYGG